MDASSGKFGEYLVLYAAAVLMVAVAQGLYWYFKLVSDYPPEYLRSTAWRKKGSLLTLTLFQSIVVGFSEMYWSGSLRAPAAPAMFMWAIACFAFFHLPRACSRQFKVAVEHAIHAALNDVFRTHGSGDLAARYKAVERRLNQLYELHKVEISQARGRQDLLMADDGLGLGQKFFFLATHLGRARLASEIERPPLLAVLTSFNGEEKRERRGTKLDRVQPDRNSNRYRVYDHCNLLEDKRCA